MLPDEILEKMESIEEQSNQSLQLLLSAMIHSDSEVRFRALEKVGELFADQALPDTFLSAVRSAMKDEDELVRSTALEVLQEHPSAVTGIEVLPYLKDGSSLVRGEAAILLGEMQEKTAANYIRESLKIAEDPEKVAMYFGLFLLGTDESLPGLISSLKSPNYIARCAAANLLTACVSVENSAEIIKALEEAASVETSKAAAGSINEALAEIRA